MTTALETWEKSGKIKKGENSEGKVKEFEKEKRNAREKLGNLRWSETKKLKISVPDNIFFLYLIMIKLCTLKQLENIHQKLKQLIKFSQ